MKKTMITATFASLLFVPTTAFAAETTTEAPAVEASTVEEPMMTTMEAPVEEPMMTTMEAPVEDTTMMTTSEIEFVTADNMPLPDGVTPEMVQTTEAPIVLQDVPVAMEDAVTTEAPIVLQDTSVTPTKVTSVGEPAFEEALPTLEVPTTEAPTTEAPTTEAPTATTLDPEFSVVDRTDKAGEQLDPEFSVVDRTDKAGEQLDPEFSVVDRTDNNHPKGTQVTSPVNYGQQATSEEKPKMKHEINNEMHKHELPMTGEHTTTAALFALLSLAGIAAIRFSKK